MADVTRRSLKFTSLDEAVRDAEHLLAVGYQATGKWTLAQCCFHLTQWLRFPMDGFPRGPLAVRVMLWTLRNTIARPMYRKVVAKGEMPTGGPTVPQSLTTADAEDRPAVEALKEMVERWKAHTGPIHPSPIFGSLTKDEAEPLQRIHMAHHLGFLVPKD